MATVELNDISNLPTLRVTCRCRDLGHALHVSIDKGAPSTSFIEINTQEHSSLHFYGLEKVRAMWSLLWNKPICLGGVVVDTQDLKDISDFIERNV